MGTVQFCNPRYIGQTIFFEDLFQICAEKKKSIYLCHDVFVVIVAQGPGEFVVAHVGFGFSFAPTPGNFVRISEFEFSITAFPCDTTRVWRVGEQLKEKLPQLNLTTAKDACSSDAAYPMRGRWRSPTCPWTAVVWFWRKKGRHAIRARTKGRNKDYSYKLIFVLFFV